MCDSDLIPLQVPRARTLKGGWYDGRNELTHNRFTEGVPAEPAVTARQVGVGWMCPCESDTPSAASGLAVPPFSRCPGGWLWSRRRRPELCPS
jgi:hypothetical protein